MKTIAFDIKESVFDNDIEAIMYVTKDIYSERYIIAIPVITFACDIQIENPDKDYEWLLKSNIGIGDPVRKERLGQLIKEAISDFDQL